MVIAEVQDFLDESASLHAVLRDLKEIDFDRATQFKGWAANDVLQHLHVWNTAAALSVDDEGALGRMIAEMRAATSLRSFERAWLGDVRGCDLLAVWWAGAERTAEVFRSLDPKQRLKWIGPPMSARSSITARQMETWAHGYEVFDLLGIERAERDRLRNIAHLGVTTFGWSYAVRGREAPAPIPRVVLTAPSGALWTWNEISEVERVEGSATDFCAVVTQTRNIDDTNLRVTGPIATEWMSIAQCFAGAARPPPAAGVRFRQSN